MVDFCGGGVFGFMLILWCVCGVLWLWWWCGDGGLWASYIIICLLVVQVFLKAHPTYNYPPCCLAAGGDNMTYTNFIATLTTGLGVPQCQDSVPWYNNWFFNGAVPTVNGQTIQWFQMQPMDGQQMPWNAPPKFADVVPVAMLADLALDQVWET